MFVKNLLRRHLAVDICHCVCNATKGINLPDFSPLIRPKNFPDGTGSGLELIGNFCGAVTVTFKLGRTRTGIETGSRNSFSNCPPERHSSSSRWHVIISTPIRILIC